MTTTVLPFPSDALNLFFLNSSTVTLLSFNISYRIIFIACRSPFSTGSYVLSNFVVHPSFLCDPQPQYNLNLCMIVIGSLFNSLRGY
jgi:hypothetical protein